MKIAYWIFTILLAALLIGEAISFLIPPILGLVLVTGSYYSLRTLELRQAPPVAV